MKIFLRSICFVIIFIFVGTGVGYAFHVFPVTSPKVSPATGLIVKQIPTDTPAPTPDVPETLVIPTLHIHAKIESVGLDKEKRMDIPRNVFDTAWYNLGVRPGQQGNAVIDGHFDTQTGAPSVFYQIKSLHPNDIIQVIDKQGKTYTYAVQQVSNYHTQTLPMQHIFGTTAQYNLNLITCGGIWNHAQKDYSERTVVYASLQK